MAGKFLTVEEAASQLGVTADEVNRLVDRKQLFPVRDGATLKFKVEEVERAARSIAEENPGADGLSLDLDLPEAGDPAATGGLSGVGEDILLDDAIEADVSIFQTEGAKSPSPSETNINAGVAAGSGLSMPDLEGGGSGSAAELVFGGDETHESEELALESIVGASSPSLAGSAIVGNPTDDDGTLQIDLGDVAIPDAGGSLAVGSGAPISGIAAGGSLALSGALDSGLSLEEGGLEVSGVDLGAGSGPSIGDDATALGGDDFELGGGGGDEESASVVIATESGDSSFFGQGMADQSSSFSEDLGTVVPSSIASEMSEMQFAPSPEMTFSIWQTIGLICCALLLLFGGFIAYDVVRTIGSPESTRLANPLLNAMADAFGWR